MHMPRTLLAPVHIHHLYAFQEKSSYVVTFHIDPTELDGPYCPWEKGLLTQSSSRRLTDPRVHHPVSLPDTTIEVVMKANHLLMNRLHQFTGPITSACDQYVQYLLAGSNPSVLNRHRHGLLPWRCQLATSHSPTFPTDGPLLST
jgi:hypothetical protein